MNWKISNTWTIQQNEKLGNLMLYAQNHFHSRYGLDLFKKNANYSQSLKQAEIDVIGIKFTPHADHLYAVDIAFHESGLQYGSREVTIGNILKKYIRTAMCIFEYFDRKNGTIIFATPKMQESMYKDLQTYLNEIAIILREFGIYFELELYANEDFHNKYYNLFTQSFQR